MDCYDENNEYYEDEVEDENLRTNLEDEDEEDVWDDSALIAAWDSAMKEYQNSHSIKANKTSTKNDTVSKAISASLNNEAMETEKSINIIREEEIESFAQQDIASALDEIEDENASTSDSVTVKERKQNVQRTSEQKIKETRQIKPQTTAKSSNLTSGRDTSYQPQPTGTIATYSSYPHHIPGYYSYPPPSATSSTAPISLHSFSEQIKGTTDTQEEQEESKLSPTEEATTSHSNTNVNNSYYNGENLHAAHYPPSAYGWYPNYYPPPPPPPGPQPPIPPSQFYPPHSSSMPTDSNIPFTPWGSSKPTDMVPPMPGFDDEALTNLIMAWYYSGYYTGLYHGRKGR